ncbi:MAG: MMPL family transporter [Coriobacteriia bacterium]|nr:MMPL family transporter [Coriobacteriia bacterium]
MERIAEFIVDRRKAIVAVFIVLALICAPLALFVKVNYNIIDYLPESSQSTKTLALMDAEFKDSVPNTKVMVHDISLPQALEYKKQFAQVEGVTTVLWLDDVIDIKQPLEFADQDLVEQYYKDGIALFDLAIKKGYEQDAFDTLCDLVGPTNAVGGEAASLAAIQGAAVSEVLGAFIVLVPLIILILALSTASWLEPLLLLLSIGVAILLNMGTNIVFTDVSFITSSVSPILQMAVSLDYSIFLLHSFADYRKQYSDVNVAMRHAIGTSFSTVASSAMTTLFGFLALVFMQFLIGADLGINLVKGIVFSFVTAMFFLPSVTLGVYKLMDRTKHRPLLPSFANIHKALSKVAIPVTVVVILAIVPSFLGQSRTDFLYGSESAGGGTRASMDNARIKEEFGSSNPVVLLVPRGDVANERLLGDELLKLSHVKSIVSYAQIVGTEVPPEILGAAITKQFYSPSYARLIIYTDVPDEGELAFATVGEIRAVAQEHYGDAALTTGRTPNLYDMKDVVQSDNLQVTLSAVLAIFLVLLITFRSGLLPIILTFTIEAAIWINLAIPYFTDTHINYIGYLVLNTVQLGATVDYAILLTNTYLRYRKTMPKKQAMHQALGTSFKSILVSATTLSLAGFTLFYTSTNPIVCDIGIMLGRGTLLSFALVVCFLPLILQRFDSAIGKLTWKADFLAKPKKQRAKATAH